MISVLTVLQSVNVLVTRANVSPLMMEWDIKRCGWGKCSIPSAQPVQVVRCPERVLLQRLEFLIVLFCLQRLEQRALNKGKGGQIVPNLSVYVFLGRVGEYIMAASCSLKLD